MPKNTAAIGKREEREIVKSLEKIGYKARRQPGSGNIDPTLPHDVVWEDSPIGRLLIEAKWRNDCGWKTLLKWMEGAPILTLKCSDNSFKAQAGQDGDRYAFLKWSTLLALVGEAAIRDDLSALEAMDVEQLPEGQWVHALETESSRRDCIQAAHQNPPKKPFPKGRKLQSRPMRPNGDGK